MVIEDGASLKEPTSLQKVFIYSITLPTLFNLLFLSANQNSHA